MAAYHRVCGFGHLQSDCRGSESAPEPMLVSSMELPYVCIYLVMSGVWQIMSLCDWRLLSGA